MKVSKAVYLVKRIETMMNDFIEMIGEKKDNETVQLFVKDLLEILDYAGLYRAELLNKDISATEYEN